jgi:hypothetical protein
MVQTALAFLVRENPSNTLCTVIDDVCFRYIADYVFALPTVALFVCTIGIFIIGHALSLVLGFRRMKGPIIWQKLVAMIRYLAYRGFHVRALRWNTAPLGVLFLGLIGTIFFFCKSSMKL